MNVTAFENIIGQETIKARLLTGVNAASGCRRPQSLFLGQAGLGKTEIAHSLVCAYDSDNVLWFNSPEEFRNTDSTEFQNLITWLKDEGSEENPKILVIDECHKFTEKATIAMQKVHCFLLKCLDDQNKGKLIQFDADRSFSYDKRKAVIVMMTNYENRINPALMSRMDVCRLSNYSKEELELIAIKMMSDNNLTVDDERVYKLLATASRGTARPLHNMIQHMTCYGTVVITREIAIRCMGELEMFPKGLVQDEARLLTMAKTAVEKNVVKAAIPNLAPVLNNSVSYLISQDLLTINGTKYVTTDEGKKYLKRIAALGFQAA
jgi:Holliday junction resolvasome RuvABC ATP-dependent DNA helicase subunit